MNRPAPLVPPEVDLTDFPDMLVEVVRLRDSDRTTECTPEQNWAAVLLWGAAWHQVPAASMPDSDSWIAKQAGYQMHGEVSPRWEIVKPGAMRGFILCSDGRWYHTVLSEKALKAWNLKLRRRHDTEKARVKQHNIRTRSKVPYPAFDAWVAAGCPTHPLVTGDTYPMSPVTVPAAPAPTGSRPTENGASANVTGDTPPMSPVTTPPCHQEQPPLVTGDKASKRREENSIKEANASLVVGQADARAPTAAPAPAPTPPPAPTAAPKRNRSTKTDVAVVEEVELAMPGQVSPRAMRYCPKNFKVTRELVQWAASEYPILTYPDDLRRETEAFRNHKFVPARERWEATWKNWIKTAAEKRTRFTRPAGGQFTTAREQQIAKHMPGIASSPSSGPPPRGPAPPPRTSTEEAIDAEPRQPRLAND